MEITWVQVVVFFAFFLIFVGVFMACTEEAAAQDQRERDRKFNESLQRRKGGK